MDTPEESIVSSGPPLSHGPIPVRELKFRSRFQEIPRYETLLKYIPCIWRKDQGRNLRGGLYLSENHIAFYCASKTAKATEEQRKLLIEIVAVAQVSKERSLSIFPDSIGIETVSGEKYIFGQLFSRNTVYKSLCDLCNILPSSRRSSMDPSVFLGGGDTGFEEADDDCDIDSAANMQRLRGDESAFSSKDHSTASSLSSSSTTPPDLKRTLSVVREVSHDESSEVVVSRHRHRSKHHGAASSTVVGGLKRSTSHYQPQSVESDVTDSTCDRHLITLLRLIVGILVLTATISVYQIYTRSVSVARSPNASLDQSLGDLRQASQSVMQVAEQARFFLSSFIKEKLRAGNKF